MLALAPNPPSIRTLTNDERAHLLSLHPDLPPTPKQCVTCSGDGHFKWRGPDGQPADFVCDCEGQWLLHRFLLHCGLGLSHARMTWADVDTIPEDVLTAVWDYHQNAEAYLRAGRGLILWGKGFGVGKTMLDVLLTKKFIAEGRDCYFTPFHQMLDSYAAGWRDPDQRRWFNRRVTNAGALSVDDLGRERRMRRVTESGSAEYRNELAESTYEFVIRDRVNGDKPTFTTSNLSPEEMRKGYGGNVMSLLAEVCEFIEVTGTDFREQARTRMAENIRLGLRRPLVLA